MIRIVIADDHSLIREGIKKILVEERDMMVVAEVNTAEQALRSVGSLKPDILLLDISLPDKSGMELMADLRPYLDRTRVLFLTMHPERLFALRALKSGAAGYLTKESAPDELVIGIRKISAGGHYISSAVAGQMADALAEKRGAGGEIQHLSPRELEVLRMIGTGVKPSGIAERMSLSVSTIHTYRTRLLHKLGLKTTSDLIRFALEKKLIG